MALRSDEFAYVFLSLSGIRERQNAPYLSYWLREAPR